MENGTLPREPWRGSMICGHQTACGMPAYCSARKGDDLPMCAEHYYETLDTYGQVRMAPGNALGAPELATRLLWEGEDASIPVEASYEEMSLYAGVLDLPRSV